MENKIIDIEARNKKMMEDVIRKFGHEASETIQFCENVERYPTGWFTSVMYNFLMKK